MTINCDIIRDLLPSYVDELTSKESNAAIDEHIKNCPACKKILENMKFPIVGLKRSSKNYLYDA